MSIIAESWASIAHTLGYATEEDMLHDLYDVQGWSIAEMAKKLGYSSGNIRRRLIFNGHILRGRGGKNRFGKGKLAHLTDLELVGNLKQIAEEHGVHLSAVFNERRKRGIRKHAVRDDSATELLEAAERPGQS